MFAVWKLVVAVRTASNSVLAFVIPAKKGLPDPTQPGAAISVITHQMTPVTPAMTATSMMMSL